MSDLEDDEDGPCPECGSLSRLNRMCPACCKPAPDRVAEGINLPPPSKHERQVLAGQDSPEADSMFEAKDEKE